MHLDTVKDYLKTLQNRITGAIAQLDGGSFISDAWKSLQVRPSKEMASPKFCKMARCLNARVVAFHM